MPYTTVSEAVETMAGHFADWEASAKQAKHDAREMKEGLKIIHEQAGLGGLESLAMAAEIDAFWTAHNAGLYAIHARWTARAKELGIDLPSIAGGGDR